MISHPLSNIDIVGYPFFYLSSQVYLFVSINIVTRHIAPSARNDGRFCVTVVQRHQADEVKPDKTLSMQSVALQATDCATVYLALFALTEKIIV